MMNCKICGISNELSKKYSVKDMMFQNGDTYNYIECQNCGVLQLASQKGNIDYSDSYYSFGVYGFNFIKRKILNLRTSFVLSGNPFGWLLSKMLPDMALESLKIIKLKKTDKILDVGCGSGLLVYLLRLYGFVGVKGIDKYLPNEICDDDVYIEKKDIFEMQEKFDFIMMHHSFEHMENQRDVLKKCYELLEKDGKLLVRIPWKDSYAWHHYEENWVQLDAPRHLFMHSRKSFKILIAESGFEIESFNYDSTPFQFIGSEMYGRAIPLSKMDENPLKLNILDRIKYKLYSFVLNKLEFGDQVAIILKKV